jgi:hypothetical protein
MATDGEVKQGFLSPLGPLSCVCVRLFSHISFLGSKVLLSGSPLVTFRFGAGNEDDQRCCPKKILSWDENLSSGNNSKIS